MSINKAQDAVVFAALSGPFDPGKALMAMKIASKPVDFAMLATRLADLCDIRPTDAEDLWLLRTPTRHTLLANLKKQDRLAAEVATRRGLDPDEQTQDLLAVLLDQAPLSRAHISQCLEGATEQAELERIILALDRAGSSAPSHDLLPLARAALGSLDRAQKMEQLAERGFFGREVELAQIAAWLAQPATQGPVGCVFLTGAPGIGKSTLLGESVRRLSMHHRPLVLRLDFDRAGLDVQDLLGLTMEATRQMAEQLHGDVATLLDARLKAGRIEDKHSKGKQSLRQQLPRALARSLGQAVLASGRPVLIVLDTLEVLRSRGESHPGALFAWLDQLIELGVTPLSVLAAGRGDALDSLQPSRHQPWRQIEQVELRGLEEAAALALLDRLGAPAQCRQELLELAQGNPLKLRLGAEIARRPGGERVLRHQRDEEVSSAFLYRLLLSRIDDPLLKKLAHPGLIVRRINGQVIREVLAPALGLDSLSIERAEELCNQLATQHWLVEADPGAPGYLKHRSDMRALLLPLLYSDAAELSARVDEAAMRWFTRLEQPWARREAMYHRLQLSRRGTALPSMSSQLAAQFDSQMLEELPRLVADRLRNLRGERSSELRGDWSNGDGEHDAAIVRESLTILKRQDWIEASYLVRSVTNEGGLDPSSPAADALRMLLWRSGQWAGARHWLQARDHIRAGDDDLPDLPAELALVRLEMRAEFEPNRLRLNWLRWRPDIARLDEAAITASDDCASQGALALLLGNLPDPYHFPTGREGESNLAAAASEIWLGVKGGEAQVAMEAGHRQLDRVGPQVLALHQVEPGRILSTLTPYASFARHLSLLPGKNALGESARHFANALDHAGGLFDLSHSMPARLDTGDPLGALTDIGLFADWAQACAFIERDEDLVLIGRAAERWRRTIAGDWSIGRRIGRWRAMPPLDQVVERRLSMLLDAPDSLHQAHWQLQVWDEATPGQALLPTLRQRLGDVAKGRLHDRSSPDTARGITRLLQARGIPALFAPALAVVILNANL
ncbi:AAA family ATPase [Pseudomonas fontis]|uniref:AAA family ATPase n=1 Tax=Pseudomonas fontis TaxID=2942633 RepID=A0ABT5NZY5_9PSED|nr:AAA family ATPase [Pseudomonas fontis]MDD0976374.1 AAA family ATPase [Pseudomonas fontis]MDD0993740.1 AAA family ATPase [Pseudomonas fontis]